MTLVLNTALCQIAIPVYNASTYQRYEIPPPPNCNHHKEHDHLFTGIVRLWKINPNVSLGFGLIIQQEVTVSSCFMNFFGSIVKSTISTKRIQPDNIERNVLIEKLQGLSIGQTTYLDITPQFQCSWLQTTIYKSSKILISKINVYRTISGSITGLGGIWNPTSNPELFKNLDKTLYIPSISDNCKNLIFDESPGIQKVVNKSSIVTIPSKHLQFTVQNDNKILYCPNYQSIIHLTNEGRLLSLPYYPSSNTTDNKKITQLKLSTNYIQSNIMFELNKISKLMTSELINIETNICILKYYQWQQMTHLNNSNLIAKYIAGDPWSIGEFSESTHIIIPDFIHVLNCTLPQRKEKRFNSLRVICNNESHWIEPISNHLIFSKYTSRISSNWITIQNKSYINYLTEQITTSHQYINISSLDILSQELVEDYEMTSIIMDSSEPEIELTKTEYPNLMDVISKTLLSKFLIIIGLLIVSVIMIYCMCRSIKACT